ncbi:hypothetical protein [Paenibacillus sp. CF384]|uniref:hypothetical protein n=1 Tax=Paenibacillus sp. CF384 TaxID=1884382 RepID=UPI00089D51DC|nr:hypothetical protein [Paenibacillus sp. CF384]SDX34463.1 hypothetical protein SAMN05518855_1012148 [Paenibacillus sp. CF384]
MTKAAQMDKLLDAHHAGINSSDLIAIIRRIFNFDLETLQVSPLPRDVLDAFLQQAAGSVTGTEVRRMINETFAINLDALSALEQARISLYSKGQWMLQHEQDLFVVHTGTDDVGVSIYPTAYYTEHAGTAQLPQELLDALISLGFACDAEARTCSYTSPHGEPVPDAFKGQTMKAVMAAIRTVSGHL